MNAKLKSMMYRFKVKHIKGKDHVIPDTFSRQGDFPLNNTQKNIYNVLPGYSESLGPPGWVSPPVLASLTSQSLSTDETDDAAEIDEYLTGIVLASITEINQQSLSPLTSPDHPTALSWSRLEAACLSCDEYKLLHKTIQSGVSDKREDWDQQIVDYFHLLTKFFTLL